MATATHWLISLPLESRNNADRTWSAMTDAIGHEADLAVSYKFKVPELRVGTLDQLMTMSDDLAKSTMLVEQVISKLKRQLKELNPLLDLKSLQVDGQSAERYFQTFQWNEAKYPVRRPLSELLGKLQELVAKIDDDLKLKVGDYNMMKSQFMSLSRKTGGTLAVRDLTDIVKPEHIISTENLTTLLVAVPTHKHKDWIESYERLAPYVVPRSSIKIKVEGEYALCSVVLFRRVLDEFKNAAREKGYQVREYTHDPEKSAEKIQEKNQLDAELAEKKGGLSDWCRVSFAETASALMHLCAIRIFVESILRFGLPPAFMPALVIPRPKQEKRLRDVLAEKFGQKGKYWDDASEDVYPYVSLHFSALNMSSE